MARHVRDDQGNTTKRTVCPMSEHRKSTIIGILHAWRRPPLLEPVAVEKDFRHSTSPEAQMELLLRFDTANGPRTIVASGVSLSVASEITQAMIQAGHFADFRDQ